ncbi:MAG: SAM-dependent methyltransferase, partial [Gordonia sp. (in: high G+C Gram-positive bacteria)]
MSRTNNANPGPIAATPGGKRAGRILFVGSGPGDPDLLTVRARAVITHARTAYIDPDVPAAVVAMLGAAHREEPVESGRKTTAKGSAAAAEPASPA